MDILELEEWEKWDNKNEKRKEWLGSDKRQRESAY